MTVKLNIHPYFLKDAKNPLTVEVTGNTVGECLNQFISKEPTFIAKAFGEAGNLKDTTHILINQSPVFLHQLERAVKDGDEIGIIYAAPVGAGVSGC